VASGALVFVALGIAVAVGISRIYLRAHWWSDVAGGWGLGAGIFALLAAVVLVVEHIRNNEDERAREKSDSAAAAAT
jgi:membrane-associated phospholipid phosphatase